MAPKERGGVGDVATRVLVFISRPIYCKIYFHKVDRPKQPLDNHGFLQDATTKTKKKVTTELPGSSAAAASPQNSFFSSFQGEKARFTCRKKPSSQKFH